MKIHLFHHPYFLFLTKGVLLITTIIIIISYIDHKGYFEANNLNNHTLKKWNAFYALTPKHKVDIILVGNSHLYTGLNPKNLSEALGMTSFILASPGTNIADSYYCLEEAAERCKPQIAIVETYGISNFYLDSLAPSSLSEQIKSFSARKNSYLKLLSTPSLFNTGSWGYAWSPALRNHSFLLTNPEQIRNNINPTPQPSPKLYLGRYVRWTSGIEDSTLLKYKTLGAPVDGEKYTYSKDAETYVRKIVDLCREKNIKLIFLTLPMYHEHIKDYSHWKNTLGKLILPYTDKWLDLQHPYDHQLLGPECFEDSYATNQHITYQGSLVCSYLLAKYIEDNYKGKLIRQDKNPRWHQLFYGEEGYFENYPPHPQDRNNTILLKDTIIDSIRIKEVDLLKNKQYQMLLIKISNQQQIPEILNSRLKLMITIKQNNEYHQTEVEIPYDRLHMTLKHHLYSITFRPDIHITDISQISL